MQQIDVKFLSFPLWTQALEMGSSGAASQALTAVWDLLWANSSSGHIDPHDITANDPNIYVCSISGMLLLGLVAIVPLSW